jgi:hypothetical protein
VKRLFPARPTTLSRHETDAGGRIRLSLFQYLCVGGRRAYCKMARRMAVLYIQQPQRGWQIEDRVDI